ncbi:type I-B CRISPR-associated protein Cas5b [Virgibacillus oceani]
MKILRIKAFQETVCYKKPFANKVTETYPLPPYSTVKGLIHSVLKADHYIPFSLSIQGDYETQIIDYRKTYFVKKHEFAMPIILEGISGETPAYSSKVMTSMPLYTHMLYNVKLVFHIKADEDILSDIFHAFTTADSFLSLGRHEDLIRIDKINWVTLQETDECKSVHSIFVPKAQCEEEGMGIPYLLNWKYNIKKGIREWERIPSIYMAQNEDLVEENFNSPILIDEQNYPVFWNQ